MLKKILSFGFIEGGAKALNIVMLLLLSYLLPVDLFGEINVIISIQVIVVGVFVFGLDKSILRLRDSYRNFWPNLFKLWVIVILLVLPISFVVIYYLIDDFFTSILLLVAILFQAIRQLLITKSRVNKSVKEFYKTRLIVQGVIFLLSIILVYFTQKVEYFILAYVISIFPLTLKYYRKVSFIKSKTKVVKEIFSFSWPLLFHTLGITILSSIDRLMLDEYLQKEDVAYYSFGYIFGGAITFVYAIFNSYLEPKLINFSERSKYLTSYRSFLIVLACLFGFILVNILPFVIKEFFNDKYLLSLPVVGIVLLTHILNPIYLQSNFRLLNVKKTRIIALATFLSGMINILLNIVLLNIKPSILNVAYATYISYLFLIIFIYILSIKRENEKIDGKEYILTIITVLLLSFAVLNIDIVWIIDIILLLTLLVNLTSIKPIFQMVLKNEH